MEIQEAVRDRCVVCGSEELEPFFRAADIPVSCHIPCSSVEQAIAIPKTSIQLVYCDNCQHIYNADYRPELINYSLGYENALHHSPRFQSYLTELGERLIGKDDIRGSQIVGVGSGDGFFLDMLCRMGKNYAIGFDPAAPQRSAFPSVRFVRDWYSDTYSDVDARLVICQHVLEHSEEPIAMLTAIRKALHARCKGLLYLEVPNALFMIREHAIWDVSEHCSYFTPRSLWWALAAADFRVEALKEPFDGQYLSADASPGADQGKAPPLAEGLRAQLSGFSEAYRQTVEGWKTWLDSTRCSRSRLALWGAGTKGVMFLNALQPGSRFAYVVDVNPKKQGMFITGTGHSIVPPSALLDDPPDAIVLLNQSYRTEAEQTLGRLKIDSELVVCTPGQGFSSPSRFHGFLPPLPAAKAMELHNVVS